MRNKCVRERERERERERGVMTFWGIKHSNLLSSPFSTVPYCCPESVLVGPHWNLWLSQRLLSIMSREVIHYQSHLLWVCMYFVSQNLSQPRMSPVHKTINLYNICTIDEHLKRVPTFSKGHLQCKVLFFF